MTTIFSLTPSPRKRLPITTRASVTERPGFQLTARDAEIIRAVYDYRTLTTWQIERLFFPPFTAKGERKVNPRCQLRLKLLYHHGYLYRDEQPTKLSEGRRPLVYFLDTAGAQFLAAQAQAGERLDWDKAGQNVSWPFLAHLLETNEVRIAVTLACRAPESGITLTHWIDDKALKSPQMKDKVTIGGEGGGERQIAVIPDGYSRLESTTGNRVAHLFWELDRRTVTGEYATPSERRDWSHKVRAYLEYHASGKYEARYGATGMRILTVTTGDRRLAHLKEITERTGGDRRFWFTTLARLTPETVLAEPIWQVAGESASRRLAF